MTGDRISTLEGLHCSYTGRYTGSYTNPKYDSSQVNHIKLLKKSKKSWPHIPHRGKLYQQRWDKVTSKQTEGYYGMFSPKRHKVQSFCPKSEHLVLILIAELLQSHCTALRCSARCSCYFVHPVYSISNASCHKRQSVLPERNWRTALWGIDVIWSNHWRRRISSSW